MRFILFISLFLAAHAQASECHVFLGKGVVKVNKGYQFVINQGSMSEKTFVLPEKLLVKIAPYLKLAVKGEFIFNTKNPETGDEVLDVVKLDHDFPDPMALEKSLVYSKTSSCP